MLSNTRLYGATIAIVSGLYSIWSGLSSPDMVLSAWAMLVIGVVVIIHGLVLVTDFVDRLGKASGPLMIGYAAAMLLIQALLAADILESGGPMMPSMGMGGSPMTAGMTWDAGMVALAVLMLLSGVIMARDAGTERGM